MSGPAPKPWTLKTVQDRIKEDGQCWIWQQCVNGHGYPMATINAKRGAHVRKFVYTELLGMRLRKGFVVSSRCHNKRCVSPECLVQKTRGDVLREMYARGARWADSSYIYRQRKAMQDRPDYVKLSLEKARLMRARFSEGASSAEVAKEFGVSDTAARDVRRGRTWREQSQNASVFAWNPSSVKEAA